MAAPLLADRALGAVLVLAGAGVGWHAQSLEVAFAADPIGPKAFPTLVALAMAVCGAVLMVAPATRWEKAERVLPGIAATVAMFVYGLALPEIGFIPATFALCVVIALAFGATPLRAAASGAVTAPALWLLLDRLLDLPLPRGPLGI